MAGPLPSPWRASAGSLLLFGGVGVALGLFVGLQDPVAGIAVALIAGGVGVLAELQAALRLNRALARFAAEVPAPAEPFSSPIGVQGLRWEEPPIEVTGQTYRFTVPPLEVATPGDLVEVPHRQVREGAREVLGRLGVL